jgi:hypothetical protein
LASPDDGHIVFEICRELEINKLKEINAASCLFFKNYSKEISEISENRKLKMVYFLGSNEKNF